MLDEPVSVHLYLSRETKAKKKKKYKREDPWYRTVEILFSERSVKSVRSIEVDSLLSFRRYIYIYYKRKGNEIYNNNIR